VPKFAKHLLGLSRKFIPVKDYSTSSDDLDEYFKKFERDTHLKVFFAGSPMDAKPEPLYVKSIWRPPLGSIPPEIDTRLYNFFKLMRGIFIKRRGVTNLLPFQHRLMAWLKKHKQWIIANTDKNLGPCAIELAQYIMDALTHLNDDSTYAILSEHEAKAEAQRLYGEIYRWTVEGRRTGHLSVMEVKYIRKHTLANKEDPFGYFYLLYKVHKLLLTPGPVKTRPVCSDCASITNPIGKWVDVMLQPLAQKMPTYFKDSFAFKDITDELRLPPRARIFTADAVSMYTNIDTNAALAVICPYLRLMEDEFDHYHAETLITALEIVMKNNIIRFGDVYRKQIRGTAMGKPPAPPWSTLFEGLHEMEFLPLWETYLASYVRFIDDVHGVWIPDGDPDTDEMRWLEFQAEVNNNHGLEWEFTERSLSANFLDLTTTIADDGTIKTKLFEKPMALYLFIPPHSAHPPGVLTGHVYGNVLRIFRLNSYEQDTVDDTTDFYRRFLARGHKCDALKPIFLGAIQNARKFLATSKKQRADAKFAKHDAAQRRLYLHLEFHPQNPSSAKIQQLFNDTVLNPPGKKQLNEVDGGFGHKVPIDAMTIAYHRAPNLGDMFSYRDISKRNGPPVSSYML